MERDPQRQPIESKKTRLYSLIEAIAGSAVGMALTTIGSGKLILVHMHEENTQSARHIFLAA